MKPEVFLFSSQCRVLYYTIHTTMTSCIKSKQKQSHTYIHTYIQTRERVGAVSLCARLDVAFHEQSRVRYQVKKVIGDALDEDETELRIRY